MFVTLLGISILVRPEQPINAPHSMLVTLLGISMLVSPEQSANAPHPMLVTLLGITVFLQPKIRVLVAHLQSLGGYAKSLVNL